MNIFEINNSNIITHKYYYQIDNFYKFPEEVEKFFNDSPPYVHKWSTPNSLNTVDFLDISHYILNHEGFIETEKKKYELLNRDHTQAFKAIQTNYMKFINLKDNYKENFWWPHIDEHASYNCLIYLNKTPCDGTNLYEKISDNEGTEHTKPWQSKNKYNILCNIKSKYNMLTIFRADIYHGMAVDSDKFKKEFRKNQVIFIK